MYFVLAITKTKRNYPIWCSRLEHFSVHTFQGLILIYIDYGNNE